jgi:hypothetical protein
MQYDGPGWRIFAPEGRVFAIVYTGSYLIAQWEPTTKNWIGPDALPIEIYAWHPLPLFEGVCDVTHAVFDPDCFHFGNSCTQKGCDCTQEGCDPWNPPGPIVGAE